MFCIQVKKNIIKNSTSLFKFDTNILFTIIFIKLEKAKKLRLCQVEKDIVFMPLNKFFDYFNCIEKDAV